MLSGQNCNCAGELAALNSTKEVKAIIQNVFRQNWRFELELVGNVGRGMCRALTASPAPKEAHEGRLTAAHSIAGWTHCETRKQPRQHINGTCLYLFRSCGAELKCPYYEMSLLQLRSELGSSFHIDLAAKNVPWISNSVCIHIQGDLGVH